MDMKMTWFIKEIEFSMFLEMALSNIARNVCICW